MLSTQSTRKDLFAEVERLRKQVDYLQRINQLNEQLREGQRQKLELFHQVFHLNEEDRTALHRTSSILSRLTEVPVSHSNPD